MLKELVRERLIAAADEILGLLEKTIASYEEQLCRAREESEQHRRQLEAVLKTQFVIRVEDVQPLIGCREVLPPQPRWGCSTSEKEPPQLPSVKVETEDPPASIVKEEEKESDVSELPPTGDGCRGAPPAHLLAPLSDSDDILKSDDKQLKGSEKRTSLDKKTVSQNSQKRATCLVCGERYPINRLIRHMTVHREEKPFRCSLCSKPFSFRHNMISHMRIHTGERPFSCSTCGAAFYRKDYLEGHMRIHTGEKPYSCSVCGGRYAYRNSLAAHMKTHNKGRQQVLQ